MIALSIRQPWAWLIIHGGKDIENRVWQTSRRGRFLVHASAGMTHQEYMDVFQSLERRGLYDRLPPIEALPRGGIVGSVDLFDCVAQSNSPWFFGPYGFVLRDPQPLPFRPFKGRLGFFEVPA